MLSGMNPFHHTFSFEPKVISYYENGKKAHPRGVCQSDKDTPLHSFHFQKIKKFVFLKVGDYMKTITRTKYLDRIIELNGTPDIKIITGIRRSGKSKLMQAYIAYLKSNFENINIIFIDFMDLAYEEIMEYHALHAYVEEHYQEGKTNYLFVDEVQMCPNFELAINSLYSKGIYDIYVTGSNAFLLSADLATLFTGRYIEIHVFPFSFQEYCQYYDDVSDKDKLFDDYTIKGGLAGSYAYRTEKDRTNYIKEVYETIVTRDLVQKYALPDTLVLQRLSEFLMDNISNLTSPNKVSQLLTANETPTNHVTVGKYIKYLLGKEYVIYSSAYITVQLVLIWTHCKNMICEEDRLEWKKVFLNVNIISIIVGVILFICRIQMPSGVQDVMDMMNNMIGPIGMLLAGMVIADVPLKIVFTKKRNYLSTDIHGEEARCKRCFHILCHNPYFCFPVLHIEYRCHTNRTFQSFQGISYLGCRIS